MSETIKVGDIAFDIKHKEYVLITNGRCIKDHSSPEAFVASHKEDCVYAPNEAIALRMIPEVHSGPTLVWTYIGVNAEDLSTVSADTTKAFKDLLNKMGDLDRINRKCKVNFETLTVSVSGRI